MYSFCVALKIGSLMFALRDIVIFYSQFIRMSVEDNFLVMLIYYMAQLGLTLSAVDTHKLTGNQRLKKQ